jgi:hypothetical protein
LRDAVPGPEAATVQFALRVAGIHANADFGPCALQKPYQDQQVKRLLHGLATRKGNAIDVVGPVCGCHLLGDDVLYYYYSVP